MLDPRTHSPRTICVHHHRHDVGQKANCVYMLDGGIEQDLNGVGRNVDSRHENDDEWSTRSSQMACGRPGPEMSKYSSLYVRIYTSTLGHH